MNFRVLAASAIMAFAAATAASSAEGDDVTIALFVAIQSNPVEQAIINAFEQTAAKDGKARFVAFDSDNSVQRQLANCNDAIASGRFDAFALKAVAGPPLMSCAAKAIAAGIPVVAFGNALGPDPDTAARQVDGLSGSVISLARTNGISLADLVSKACDTKAPETCEVIYLYGPLAFDWASITRKSFEATMAAEHPEVKIVASGAYNFDPNQARTLTKTLLQIHPDADVIASDADLGAIGVVAALKDMGKVPGKEVLVTGGALSKAGKAMLEAGEMFGSTCLMPMTEAETAANYAILAARDQPIVQPDVEVCAVHSPTGTAPITAENAERFMPEW